MKKLGNAILMIDIPFNIAGIILCMWRINIMLHSDLQRLIDEKGGIGAVNTLIVVGAVCCCMFLVLNIICAVGRARHKESMIAEGMTGISFLIIISFSSIASLVAKTAISTSAKSLNISSFSVNDLNIIRLL